MTRRCKYILIFNDKEELVSKECAICKEVKSVDNFYLVKNGIKGYGYPCKLCTSLKAKLDNAKDEVKIRSSLRSKEYRKDNYEKCRERELLYEKLNKEKVLKCKLNYARRIRKDASWKIKNKEKQLKNSKKWRECNPQYMKEYLREYHKRPEVVEKRKYQQELKNKRTREWRLRNKQKVSDYNKKYKTENKDIVNSCVTERTSRKRLQETFSHNFREDSKKLYLEVRLKNKEIKSKTQSLAIDHIIPLNHPNVCGLHYPENFKVITKSENSKKKNKWDGTQDNKNWEINWRIGRDLNTRSTNE